MQNTGAPPAATSTASSVSCGIPGELTRQTRQGASRTMALASTRGGRPDNFLSGMPRTIWHGGGAFGRRLSQNPHYGRTVGVSAPGKSAGTFWVTLPVAAHSVPRRKVTMNATSLHCFTAWPKVVWNTRPLPY